MGRKDQYDEDTIPTSRKHQRNANYLLNFAVDRAVHVDTPVESRPRSIPVSYTRSYYQDPFVKANFQFIVKQDSSPPELDKPLHWDQLVFVLCHEACGSLSKCPICIDNPIAARITKCGHIFCWTCLLRMFQASLASEEDSKTINIIGNVNLNVYHKYLECPLCTEMISLCYVKPVSILEEPIKYEENKRIKFQLLKKHRYSSVLELKDSSIDLSFQLPSYSDENSKFCRFLIDTNDNAYKKLIESDIYSVKKAIEASDEDELSFYELALIQLQSHLDILNENTSKSDDNDDILNSIIIKKQDKSIESNDFIYIYKEESGQHIFLHPICTRALLNEFGEYKNLPESIESRILELEEITIDEVSRKRFKFLSCLPLTSVCYICEIDMRSLVSKKSLDPLLPKIKKRIYARKQKKHIEKKEAEKYAKNTSYKRDEPILIDPSEFESLPSTIDDDFIPFVDEQTTPKEAPTWVKDTEYYSLPPKELRQQSTGTRRKVRGADGESDEEYAAPSFAASFYQSINFKEPVSSSNEKTSETKSKGKRKRKKQVLFSTYA